MSFPERALNACVEAMESGKVSARQIRDVIKYDGLDVSRLKPFLSDDRLHIRRAAIQIVGRHGSPEMLKMLVEVAQVEPDVSVLLHILEYLGMSVNLQELDELAYLTNHENGVVKEASINMFRKAGRADNLFPLLFDDNESTVSRVKRYIENEQED